MQAVAASIDEAGDADDGSEQPGEASGQLRAAGAKMQSMSKMLLYSSALDPDDDGLGGPLPHGAGGTRAGGRLGPEAHGAPRQDTQAWVAQLCDELGADAAATREHVARAARSVGREAAFRAMGRALAAFREQGEGQGRSRSAWFFRLRSGDDA